MKHLLHFSLLAIFLMSCSNAFAQRAGTLDTTFNHDGIVYNPVGTDTFNGANAIAIQNDGKIVMVGTTNKNGIVRGALVRYNTNGTLDSSFNKTGYIITKIDSSYGTQIFSVAVQSNGKIVVLGTINKAIDSFFLERYNTDGSLDATFGNNGIDLPPINGEASAVALQADGKIVLGGTSIYLTDAFEVARLDSNGNLDNTFGSGGVSIIGVGPGILPFSGLNGLAIQADGKIVGAGFYSPALNISRFALIRLNVDGSLDSTFANGGRDTANYTNYKIATAGSVIIQPDGKTIIAGNTDTTIYSNSVTFAIARYNSNGTFDTTFATKGIFSGKNVGFGSSLVLQPDNKIVAVASVISSSFTSDFAIVRLNTDGTPDTSFGSNGQVLTSIISKSNSVSQCVALQTDEKIVVGGYTQLTPSSPSYFAVARYISGLSAGVLNLSKVSLNILIYPNPVHNTETLDYILTNDETLTISLYDVTGRVIKTFINNEKTLAGEHKQQLNFENLATGCYLITISNTAGKSESVKVMKQ